jgi:hypothetical protein
LRIQKGLKMIGVFDGRTGDVVAMLVERHINPATVDSGEAFKSGEAMKAALIAQKLEAIHLYVSNSHHLSLLPILELRKI